MKRIYLDYASITPLDKRVLKVMMPFLKEIFYNPSALHQEGRHAKVALDTARKNAAHIIQCKPDEIFFTAGGTEANNIALLGIARKAREQNKEKKIHVITSVIEHASILEVFIQLEKEGVDVTYLEPNDEGMHTTTQVVEALRPETIFISLSYGNNEIGTINPISKISKAVKQDRKKRSLGAVVIHTDASQGACYLNIRSDYLGVDLMTLDSSKLYGPRGTGILYKKRGLKLEPILFGGGHESGVRPGTENVASIVGMVKALEICITEQPHEIKRLTTLRNYFFDEIKKEISGSTINGSLTDRLPNNINFCVPGTESEFLVIKLDLLGVACSSVTTCKNISADSSSYVLEALDKKRNTNCAQSSLRLSLGRFITKKDIIKILTILKKEYNAH